MPLQPAADEDLVTMTTPLHLTSPADIQPDVIKCYSEVSYSILLATNRFSTYISRFISSALSSLHSATENTLTLLEFSTWFIKTLLIWLLVLARVSYYLD